MTHFADGPDVTPPSRANGVTRRDVRGRRPRVAADAPGGVTLAALSKAFGRRWLLAVCLGVLAGGAAAAAVWLWLPAKYTAFAMLRIAAAEPRLVFPQSPDAKVDLGTYQRTQASLLKSPLVINAALREPKIAQLSIVGDRSDPVNWLATELKVEYTPGSEVLRVSITGEKADELAALVNAVKEAYVNEIVNGEQQQRRNRIRELEQVFSESEEKMRGKRNSYRQLARSLGTSDSQALTLKQQIGLQQYGELKREHTRVSFELMRARVEAVAEETKAKGMLAAEVPENLVEQLMATDPVVVQTLGRVSQIQDVVSRFEAVVAREDDSSLLKYRGELETAKKSLEDRRTELRPAIVERLKEQMKAEVEHIATKAREKITLLADQEKLLAAEVERFSKEVDKMGATSSDLEAMRADIDQNETINKRVGTELEALKIEARSRPRVTVLQDAEVPQSADGKRQLIAMAAAGLAGFGLAAFLVSFLELRSRRIHAASELSDELGLRVLGVLPLSPHGHAVAGRGEQGFSLFNESIDGVRTMLLHESSGEAARSGRVVLVTSAVGGEGKTTLACHLSASLARAGRKTLLIDCDLRRPAAHQPFQLSAGPGLAEVLRGEAEADDVIRQPDVGEPGEPVDRGGRGDLSVLTAGRPDRQVIQAVARNGIQKIIEMMKLHFDFVVLDSCPVLPVADALMIGQSADSALLAVMRGVSQAPKLQAACERLSTVGVHVLGAVVHGEEWHLADGTLGADYRPVPAAHAKAGGPMAA